MPNLNISLRPFEERDSEAIIDLLMDVQVKKTFMIPDFATRQEAQPRWNRLLQLSREDGRFVRAICVADEAVGLLNDVEQSGEAVEVGYALLPQHWGRGYAAAALKLAMEALFAQGFETVKASAFEENAPSMRVMEKAGMVPTGQTETVSYRGENKICICYEKTRTSQEDAL